MDCGLKQKVGSGIRVVQLKKKEKQPAHPTPAAQRTWLGSWVWCSRQTQPLQSGPRVPIQVKHANLGRAHNPPSTAKRRTQKPHDKEGWRWDETTAHKPRDTEGGHGEPNKSTLAPHRRGQPASWNKCTHAPWCKGQAQGAKTTAHKLRDAQGELGAEGSPHKCLWSRRIHTSTCLASFGQLHRVGQGNRSGSNDPRDK